MYHLYCYIMKSFVRCRSALIAYAVNPACSARRSDKVDVRV